MTNVLADHLKGIRDGFKTHAHDGVTLSTSDVLGLIIILDELIAVARGKKTDIGMPERHDLDRPELLSELGCNVLAFPGKRQERSRPPGNGGDAA